jgi:hypothetical protein
MPLSTEEQFGSLLQFLCLGAACGAVYDCLRILRVCFGLSCCTHIPASWKGRALPLIGVVDEHRFPASRPFRLFLIGIGDVFFALAAGVGFSVCLFAAGSGVFRWYTLAAAGTGFVLYSVLPGRVVMLFTESAAYLLRVVGRYCLWLILFPLRCTARFCVRAGYWIRRRCMLPLRAYLTRMRRVAYTHREKRHLILAVQSFGKELIDEQLEK